MGLMDHLLLELDERNSWLLLLLVAVCVAARGLLPEAEKRRIVPLVGVTLLHLVLVAATAWVEIRSPANVRYVRLPSFILNTVAYVGVFNFIVFSMVLARFSLGVHLVLRDVVSVAVTVVAVLMMSARLGFNITGVFVSSAAILTALALALQKPIVNVMGRVALQLDHSIKLGDWIALDNQQFGRVVKMGWRYAALETNNWETLVVPNSQLLDSRFTVYGRREGEPFKLRRWIWFHIDYRTPPAEVLRIVAEALNEEELPHVARQPRPHGLLAGMDQGTARYAARYWLTDLAEDDVTDSLVRTRLLYALRRAGVEVAMPAQSVLLTEQDEARAMAEAESDLRMRSRALSRVGLFHGLKEQERHRLARSMRRAPFAEGELLTRQGAEAHWLYIIERGRVSVRVALGGLESREVAQLGAGDYFGEMGLMTGEPRTATVVALSNVDCFRLDKEAFTELLSERPEIAESMAEGLARRKTELEAVRENLDKEAQSRRQAESKRHLLGRIKDFFKV